MPLAYNTLRCMKIIPLSNTSTRMFCGISMGKEPSTTGMPLTSSMGYNKAVVESLKELRSGLILFCTNFIKVSYFYMFN